MHYWFATDLCMGICLVEVMVFDCGAGRKQLSGLTWIRVNRNLCIIRCTQMGEAWGINFCTCKFCKFVKFNLSFPKIPNKWPPIIGWLLKFHRLTIKKNKQINKNRKRNLLSNQPTTLSNYGLFCPLRQLSSQNITFQVEKPVSCVRPSRWPHRPSSRPKLEEPQYKHYS